MNKYLLIFLSLYIILVASFTLLLKKYFPIPLVHALSACQTMMRNFSVQLPHHLGIVVPFLIFFLCGITLVKLIALFIRIQETKNQLLWIEDPNTEMRMVFTEAGVEENIVIIRSNSLFAICFGIVRTKIYLSTALIEQTTREELLAVLLHEQYHLRKKDTLTLYIALVSQSLVFFFPILADLLKSYRIEREIEADKEAIKKIGDPKPLVSALLKHLDAPTSSHLPVTAFAGEDTLKFRIQAFTSNTIPIQTVHPLRFIVTLSILFLLGGLLIAPVQAVEVHSKNHDMVMLCENGTACGSLCQKNTSGVSHMRGNASYMYSPRE